MRTRKLLVVRLDRQLDQSLLSRLSRRWSLATTDSPAAARQYLRRHRYPAGLVCFGKDVPTALSLQLAHMLDAASETNWVALVHGIDPRDAALCELLSSSMHDFCHHPVDLPQLEYTLGHAAGRTELGRASRRPANRAACRGPADDMVGDSPAIVVLRRHIAKVARVNTPVLITGESGTGKELVARSIHHRSHRSAAPFVAINCAAIPPGLAHSELFGHEKGAFTGAHARATGLIESANHGTVFLDEIGDLPPEIQVNLLRFLDGQPIARLGSNQPAKLDVRVIAATNIRLDRAVLQGDFRPDLYYRLKVIQLCVPSLRERGDDMQLLARHFIGAFSEPGTTPPALSYSAVRALYRHDWPGNVRELINCIRSGLALRDGSVIRPRDLGLSLPAAGREAISLEQVRARAEQEAIEAAMAASGANISDAARQLRISRATLYRLLDKYSMHRQPDASARPGQADRRDSTAGTESRLPPWMQNRSSR